MTTTTTTAPTTAAAPTTPSSVQSNLDAGQKNLTTSYDTFLKLLTTQLQHQDPTSPLDPNQFTQQLVQMTGVQQQLLSNSLLQSLVSGGQTSGLSQAVGMIGKSVTAQSATATLSHGAASWNYDLASTAKDATIAISDSSGRVIWSGNAPDVTAGSHTFAWNGRDSSNSQRNDGGNYTITVSAKDAAGVDVAATTSIQGVATAVRQSNGQTLVNIGATEVPLSKVTQVGAS